MDFRLELILRDTSFASQVDFVVDTRRSGGKAWPNDMSLTGFPMQTPQDLAAVIKSAASAASRKTTSRGPRPREATRPLLSGSFPGSWPPGFGLPGGCAGSQLDHGCKISSREVALAAELITAAPKCVNNLKKTLKKRRFLSEAS